MRALESLLAITDFSDDAGNGVERAARLASEHGAELGLLHVMSGPSLVSLRELFSRPADAEASLLAETRSAVDQAAGKLADAHRVSVSARVKIGVVLTEVLAALEEADLLVLGAHGESPIRELVLGTTAERLLGKSMRPSLVVKRAPKDTYRRILVPVDFSPFSAAALAAALRIAPAADIYVCHAFHVPFEGKLWIAGVSDERIQEYRVEARQRALADLQGLIEPVEAGARRHLAPMVGYGDPVRVILDKEAAHGADLIVIGKHGRSPVEEFFLGGVTRRVLSESRCDVLVVSEKRPDQPQRAQSSG